MPNDWHVLFDRLGLKSAKKPSFVALIIIEIEKSDLQNTDHYLQQKFAVITRSSTAGTLYGGIRRV